jgi:hypothetical protein
MALYHNRVSDLNVIAILFEFKCLKKPPLNEGNRIGAYVIPMYSGLLCKQEHVSISS